MANNHLILHYLRRIFPKNFINYYEYIFSSKELYLREKELEKVFLRTYQVKFKGLIKNPFLCGLIL